MVKSAMENDEESVRQKYYRDSPEDGLGDFFSSASVLFTFFTELSSVSTEPALLLLPSVGDILSELLEPGLEDVEYTTGASRLMSEYLQSVKGLRATSFSLINTGFSLFAVKAVCADSL